MTKQNLRPFHIAMPTNNLKETLQFYQEKLGCTIGRQDTNWVDLNFFGHQLVFHYQEAKLISSHKNMVDQKKVQIPHFGVVLSLEDFDHLAEKLVQEKIKFTIEPYTRFKGTNGEQRTMFFLDPNDYAIEFKAFKDDELLFKSFS